MCLFLLFKSDYNLHQEDAAEVAERNQRAQKVAEEKAMAERSTALRRKLPRPIACTEENIISASGQDKPVMILMWVEHGRESEGAAY